MTLPIAAAFRVNVNASDESFAYTVAFWPTVPANNQVANPAASSQVPWAPQSVLSALRAGTIVEVIQQTGLFPSGTTATAVWTTSTSPPSVETMFSTIQTALTNAASPVAGVIGTFLETGGVTVASTPSVAIYDPVPELKSDIYWAASSGLVPGVSYGRATGFVTAQTEFALTAINGTTYTPQGSNGARSLVSASANDSASGTGAQQVTIYGYLATGSGTSQTLASASEVVTLNGTTAVNTVNQYAYIDSMVVTQVGSGGKNAGVISLMTGTAGAGTAWASIGAPGGVGSNQTFYGHHYVPSGVTCYILGFDAADSGGIAETHVITVQGNPGAASELPAVQIGTTLVTYGPSVQHPFEVAIAVPGPNLIQLWAEPMATSSANTAFGNVEWIQF